ncbi:MAG: polysaccharide deacetylase family protein [Burkholderiales bacterium]|nr:polysaccharide deacetylase family protein [Nitrosomonas sp.]MCP5276354.1 polysaccharide deacetylase family protein [Burkholderiales bacterium]
MNLKQGIFTVSLDFELYWGVRDKLSIEQYGDNLLGVRKAIPEILRVFENSDIHATWATVGFLFFNDSDELSKHLPELQPTYSREELSPYKYMDTSTLDPKYHFAPDLINNILEHKGQEIGTHTFSHYYCLENGQLLEQFEADIKAAIKAAERVNAPTKSFVFPRNQWNATYLSSLDKLGIQCFRGNEGNWIYKASDDEGQNKLQRAFRLADTYLNLSGYNTFDLASCAEERPFNIPSSRFLRPYSKKLAFLDGLKLRRIKKAMSHAASNNKIFHLWWHPHNFGVNINKNISFLSKIADHYDTLSKEYGMKSLNMGEICNLLEPNNG